MRLTATNRAIKENLLADFAWPAGCRGAPNAYAVFVGPSPGAADKDQNHQTGGVDRPIGASPAKFGDGFGVEEFRDKKQRNWKWRRLFNCIVGEGDAYRNLTGVWNLDWGTFADQRAVAHEHLHAGKQTVFDLIPKVKPRVLVMLTKGVAEIFRGYLIVSNIRHSQFFTQPTLEYPIAYSVNFPGVGFPTLVFKTPRHPSRIPLSAEQQAWISKLVGNFERG